MSDFPDAPDLPPGPADFWPEVPHRRTFYTPDNLPAPGPEIAAVLGRVVHLEMHGSGVGTAHAKAASGWPGRALHFNAQWRAETAARNWNHYRDLHDVLPESDRATLTPPDDLKAAATVSYRVGLRDGKLDATVGVLSAAESFLPAPTEAEAVSLPEAPADLWPEVTPLRTGPAPLPEDLFPVSLDEISRTVAWTVHREMRGAGEGAAAREAAGQTPALHRAELRFHSKIRTDAAARALELYRAVHQGLTPGIKASHPSPEDLRAAATISYRIGLHDGRMTEERARLLHPDRGAFNDALYEQLRRKPPGRGPGFRR